MDALRHGSRRPVVAMLALRLGVLVMFGLVVVMALRVARIAVPLYVSTTGSDVHANVPMLPVVPLIAGIAFGALGAFSEKHEPTRGVLLGALIGTGAAMYAGLLDAARIPFHDPYFTLPYRVYALLFVLAVSALCTRVFLRWIVRGREPWAGAALLAAFLVAAASAFASREWLIGIAATTGMVAGMISARSGSARLDRILRDERVIALSIAAAAFALRTVFGLQTLARTGPGLAFAVASDDGPSYYENAIAMVADPGTVPLILAQQAGFPPGYSMFLAGVFAVTGGSLGAVVVLQALAAAVAALALFALARMFTGTLVAALAAGTYATSLNLIQNGSTLAPEALLVPMILVSFWCVGRYRDTQSGRWLLATAVLVGAIYFTRNVVGIALFAAHLLWTAFQRRPLSLRAREIVALSTAMIVAVLPVLLATAFVLGRPIITNQLAAAGYQILQEDGLTVDNGFLLERGIDPFKDLTGSLVRVLVDPLPILGFLAAAVPHRVSTLLFFAPSGAADPLFIANPSAYDNVYGEFVEIIRAGLLVLACGILLVRRAWRAHPLLSLLALYVVLYVAIFAFIIPPRHAFRYRIPTEPLRYVAEAAALVVVARAAMGALRTRSLRSTR